MTHSNQAGEPEPDEWYEWGDGRDWKFSAVVDGGPFADAVRRVATVCDWAVLEFNQTWMTLRGINEDEALRVEVQKECVSTSGVHAARVGVHVGNLASLVAADDSEPRFGSGDRLNIRLQYNKLAWDKPTKFRIEKESGPEYMLPACDPESLPNGIDLQVPDATASATLSGAAVTEQFGNLSGRSIATVLLKIDAEGLTAICLPINEDGLIFKGPHLSENIRMSSVRTGSAGTASQQYPVEYLCKITRMLPPDAPVLIQIKDSSPAIISVGCTTFTLAPTLSESEIRPLGAFTSGSHDYDPENRSLEEFAAEQDHYPDTD